MRAPSSTGWPVCATSSPSRAPRLRRSSRRSVPASTTISPSAPRAATHATGPTAARFPCGSTPNCVAAQAPGVGVSPNHALPGRWSRCCWCRAVRLGYCSHQLLPRHAMADGRTPSRKAHCMYWPQKPVVYCTWDPVCAAISRGAWKRLRTLPMVRIAAPGTVPVDQRFAEEHTPIVWTELNQKIQSNHPRRLKSIASFYQLRRKES